MEVRPMPVKTYGKVKKTFILLIEMICAAVLVASVYVLIATFDKSMFKDGRLVEADYFETETFKRDATTEFKRLLNYAHLRNNFETGANYNLDKYVDLKDYIEKGIITGNNNNGVAYTVGDLIDWGRKGLEYEDVTLKDKQGTEHNFRKSIREDYKTVTEETLADLFRRGIIDTEESFDQYQTYLEKAIKTLPGDIIEYKQENTKFRYENSNLRYVIVCNGSFFTNLKLTDGKETLEDLENKIMANRVYLRINSEPLAFESTFMDIESEMYRSIDALKSFNNNSYSIFISVDTELPANDSLKTSFTTYQSLQSWFWTCMFTGIASLVGLVASLIYITLIAGYRDSNKRVYLNSFDNLYTELALALVVLGVVFVQYEAGRFVSTSFTGADYVYNIMVLGIAAFFIDAIVLCGYLTIIRRQRAGTLYTNSLVYAATSPVKTAIGTKVITLRVVVLYLLAITMFLALSYFSFARGLQVAAILLVLAIIIVGTFLIRESFLRKKVIDGAARIADGDIDFKIDLKDLKNDNLVIAEIINTAGAGISNALSEQIKSEKLKADLITNVSHDIKTPLTSIINYVELLKREEISDPKIQGYIAVLEEKSFRLKQLTEDLVEASKISSGNIEITLTDIDFKELINQTEGEFIEKFEAKNLELNTNLPEESVRIVADGMRIWRVIENLYNNVAKYALPNTRVYVDLEVNEGMAELSIKNISAQALNISADELTERFIRGDISRSTEGSGLGLSIARSLTTLQGGTFNVYLDGDLFKVTVGFPMAAETEEE